MNDKKHIAEHWSVVLCRIVLLVGFLAGIGFIFYAFDVKELSSRENTLLGILLAIFSIAASWLVTHVYAVRQRTIEIQDVQETNKENLRMYALKAAEKVNNLSNELQKLTIYLQDELDFTNYPNSEIELNAKEERLESAIHLINTLKSVNDTSLSDWHGVIGDEIDEQKRERVEQEEEVSKILDRMENLVETQRENIWGTKESTLIIHDELNALKKDLKNTLITLGAPSLLTKMERKNKRAHVETKCPNCGEPIVYDQRPIRNSVKILRCGNCEAKIVARYDEVKGHFLETYKELEEKIRCPVCKEETQIMLSNVPGTSVHLTCKCGVQIKVKRSNFSIIVTPIKPTELLEQKVEPEFTEDIIEKVKAALPEQPWPDKVHRKVATDLGISKTMVHKAIRELVIRGVFKEQIDGKLFDLTPVVENVESVNSPSSNSV
jgi:ssDNA-binding Zn-finger/Zn-ribbon topoisomerase 1/uncharacterized membrane protein (DUF485 family)